MPGGSQNLQYSTTKLTVFSSDVFKIHREFNSTIVFVIAVYFIDLSAEEVRSRNRALRRALHHAARAKVSHQVVPVTGHPATVQMGEENGTVLSTPRHLKGADDVGRIAGHQT